MLQLVSQLSYKNLTNSTLPPLAAYSCKINLCASDDSQNIKWACPFIPVSLYLILCSEYRPVCLTPEVIISQLAAFSYRAHFLWHNLLTLHSLTVFKSKPKSHLFDLTFRFLTAYSFITSRLIPVILPAGGSQSQHIY